MGKQSTLLLPGGQAGFLIHPRTILPKATNQRRGPVILSLTGFLKEQTILEIATRVSGARPSYFAELTIDATS
jgi:hypothetical protein